MVVTTESARLVSDLQDDECDAVDDEISLNEKMLEADLFVYR